MKACILFTGTGPILVLTSYEALTDPYLVEKLMTKGIKKYIAFEIPIQKVKDRYGLHYTVVLNDLSQASDLRVLDYDGHHVFYNFSFEEMGDPIFHEG